VEFDHLPGAAGGGIDEELGVERFLKRATKGNFLGW